MTVRAILLGLLGAACISAVGFAEFILQLTYVVGNHLPVFVFGGLVTYVLILDPLLRAAGLGLSSREVATILILMLASCAVSTNGLLRSFATIQTMPAHLVTQNVAWGPARNNLLAYVPDEMLSSKVDDSRVVGSLIQGMGSKTAGAVGLFQLPWAMKPSPGAPGELTGWSRPLRFWLPLVALTLVGLVGLGAVVHRQWSSAELLRYPIVDFTSGILEHQPGRLFAKIFYDRLFWIGLGTAVFIHVVNGCFAWFPGGVKIPLSLDMIQPLTELWPDLLNTNRAWGVVNPTLYIGVAAFSYLLASEIGLSLGLSNLLFCIVAALLINRGVELREDYWTGGQFAYQVFGSYVGVAAVILYTGRNYYWAVLRRAFAIPARQDVPAYGVWGARVFLLCMTGAVIWLTRVGIDPVLAIIVMLLISLMFLIIGRINVETGLFFIQPGWPVVGIMLGLFGMQALGPKMLIPLSLVVSILAVDPRESLMPFVLNGLKLAQREQLSPGKAAPWMGAALLLAIAVGVPVSLWAQYNWGVNYSGERWMAVDVPSFTFDTASREIDRLRAADTLDSAGQYTGLARLAHILPNREFLIPAGIGLILVLGIYWARLRWARWPIHPVLLLVWSSVPMAHFAASFLLGWLMRALVIRFGGGRMYQRVKPLMYGLIAGDLLGGLIFMAAGTGYFAIHGLKPPTTYRVYPM